MDKKGFFTPREFVGILRPRPRTGITPPRPLQARTALECPRQALAPNTAAAGTAAAQQPPRARPEMYTYMDGQKK